MHLQIKQNLKNRDRQTMADREADTTGCCRGDDGMGVGACVEVCVCAFMCGGGGINTKWEGADWLAWKKGGGGGGHHMLYHDINDPIYYAD